MWGRIRKWGQFSPICEDKLPLDDRNTQVFFLREMYPVRLSEGIMERFTAFAYTIQSTCEFDLYTNQCSFNAAMNVLWLRFCQHTHPFKM